MQLRPLQDAFISDLRTAFRTHRRVLGVAATGFGKTVCFSYMAHSAAERGRKVLILTHRAELVDQIERALAEFGGGATVASIQTVARRPEWPRPDFVIVDECHHAAAKSWSDVLARWPEAHILGVTATPARLDGRGLGDQFDTMVLGPDAGTLIAQGLLCRPVYYAPSAPDVSEVPVTAGDYQRDALVAAMDKPSITGSAVAEYRKRADGMQALVFCVSRAHAESAASEFPAAGVRARVFHGGLSATQRASTMAMFRENAVKVLVTVDLVGEGLDVPSVGAVILLRPTASLCLHLQQIGRGLRTAPGKDRVVILDHAGNLARHGLAEWPRTWTLEGRPRRSRPNEAPLIAIARCPKCYAVASGGTVACPECGAEMKQPEKPAVVKDGLLTEVVVATCPRCSHPSIRGVRCGGCKTRDKDEEKLCRSYADWMRLETARGHKKGWAGIQYAMRRKWGRVNA